MNLSPKPREVERPILIIKAACTRGGFHGKNQDLCLAVFYISKTVSSSKCCPYIHNVVSGDILYQGPHNMINNGDVNIYKRRGVSYKG